MLRSDIFEKSLREGTQDCVRTIAVQEIFEALRTRFVISCLDARKRLNTFRKEANISLQEHATEVQRLVGLTCVGLPEDYQHGMVINIFCSSLGDDHYNGTCQPGIPRPWSRLSMPAMTSPRYKLPVKGPVC